MAHIHCMPISFFNDYYITISNDDDSGDDDDVV